MCTDPRWQVVDSTTYCLALIQSGSAGQLHCKPLVLTVPFSPYHQHCALKQKGREGSRGCSNEEFLLHSCSHVYMSTNVTNATSQNTRSTSQNNNLSSSQKTGFEFHTVIGPRPVNSVSGQLTQDEDKSRQWSCCSKADVQMLSLGLKNIFECCR